MRWALEPASIPSGLLRSLTKRPLAVHSDLSLSRDKGETGTIIK